jgi:excisionase family DNA binding protein
MKTQPNAFGYKPTGWVAGSRMVLIVSSISIYSTFCYLFQEPIGRPQLPCFRRSYQFLSALEMIIMRTDTELTLPSEQDALLAQQTSRALIAHDAEGTGLRVQVMDAGRELHDLPAPAVRLLMEILKELGEGRAVTIVPVDAEITTQQAADLLNVSRPYLVGMIEKGTLPARMVGNQRRLPLKDVLAYKTENRAKRREALRELAALDQELGLR